jgi:hypothetical protein
MRKRDQWIERIKAVEVEYLVATLAVMVLRDRLSMEPYILAQHLHELADLERMEDNLESTYFVRLYAVFEAALRDCWRLAFNRITQPPVRDLLDGIGSARRVESKVLLAAQRVRAFRNALVHEQDEMPEETFTIAQARRHLTHFSSYRDSPRLPIGWQMAPLTFSSSLYFCKF